MRHTLIVANDTITETLLGLLSEAGIRYVETDSLDAARSTLDNEAADIALVAPGTGPGHNRLQLLNTAIEAFVNSTNDPDQFLNAIVSQAQRITEADWVLAVRVNSHGTATRLADSPHQGGSALRLEDATRPGDHSHTRWIIREGKIVCITDVEAYRQHGFHTPEYGKVLINPKTLERGFRALIGVPLQSTNGDKATTTGVMWFHYRQPQPQGWPQQVIEAIEQFARQVATAYEDARRSQIINRWQSNLNDLPLNVDEADDSADSALKRIAEELCDVLDCDFATLYVDDPTTQQRHIYSHLRDDDELLRLALKESPRELVDRYLDLGTDERVFEVEDTTQDKEFKKWPVTKLGAVKSLIILRLHEGEHRGLAFVSFREPRTFTSYEKAVIGLFARQLARMIQNIQLYQQAIEERKRLRNRFRISQSLIKGRDTNDDGAGGDRVAVLTDIIEDAKKALVADHAAIIAMHDGKPLPAALSDGAPERLRRDIHLQNLTKRIVNDKCIITLDRDGGKLTRWTVDDKAETLLAEPEALEHFPLLNDWPICKGFPLKDGDKVLGTMWLFYKEFRYNDEKVLYELQLYANFIAFAYADGLKTRRYQRAVETLRGAAESLKAQEDTGGILREAGGLARQLVARTENHEQYFSHIALVEGHDDERFVHFYEDHNDRHTFEYLQGARQLKEDNPNFDDESPYKDDPWARIYGKEACTIVSRAAEMAIANQKNGAVHEALLADSQTDGDHHVPLWPDSREDSDLTSQISAPIIVDNEVYGILSIEHRSRFAFDDEDKYTLMALANMVGTALSYKWRDMYLEALREVSKHIHDAGQDRKQVLQAIVNGAATIIRGKRPNDDFFCYIGLVEDGELRLEAASSDGVVEMYNRLTRETGKLGVIGQVLRDNHQPDGNNQSLLINDVHENHRYSGELLSSNEFTTRSQMLAWFFIDDKVINGGGVQRGILSFDHVLPGAFTEREKEVIEALAELARAAIHNAERHQLLDTLRAFVGASIDLTAARHDQAIRVKSIDPYMSEILQNTARLLDAYGNFRSDMRRYLLGNRVLDEDQWGAVNDYLRDNFVQQQKARAEKTLNSAERLEGLIGELQPSASNRPRMRLGIKPQMKVALIDTIRRTIERFQYWLATKGDTEYRIIEPNGPELYCLIPGDWLEQVFNIYIKNAHKYNDRGNDGRLTINIRLLPDGSNCEVEFHDNGPGVPQEKRAGLGTMPVKSDTGHGIGLCAARLILQAYGAGFTYHPPANPDDRGTTFVVRIPVVDELNQ